MVVAVAVVVVVVFKLILKRKFNEMVLRTTASKYRESADSKENSDFLLLRQKERTIYRR